MNGRRKQVRREACAPRHDAFTLIEILIVVVILGILAAIVLPQFSNASHLARENTLKDDLRYLRTQIAVFKAQHRDVPPGYNRGNTSNNPTEKDFVEQMTMYTDENCNVSAASSATFKYGPYLHRMPSNPLSENDGDKIKMIFNDQPVHEPDNTTGWIFKPQTLELIANLSGADKDGAAYRNY